MPAVPRVDRLKTIYSAAKALNFGWRFSDSLRTPAYNGVSRYMPQIHRITFRFCKQTESSVGVRNFINRKLFDLGHAGSASDFTKVFRRETRLIRLWISEQ